MYACVLIYGILTSQYRHKCQKFHAKLLQQLQISHEVICQNCHYYHNFYQGKDHYKDQRIATLTTGKSDQPEMPKGLPGKARYGHKNKEQPSLYQQPQFLHRDVKDVLTNSHKDVTITSQSRYDVAILNAGTIISIQ